MDANLKIGELKLPLSFILLKVEDLNPVYINRNTFIEKSDQICSNVIECIKCNMYMLLSKRSNVPLQTW